MPKSSPSYCKNTPVSSMGFTQIASCKAQGYIPRTSRKHKGKTFKSPKYRTSINRKRTSRAKTTKTSRKLKS
jgi:hypothetical protein